MNDEPISSPAPPPTRELETGSPRSASAASSHSHQHSGFIGPNGLRAGWRMFIFLAIVAGLFTLLFAILGVLRRGQPGAPGGLLFKPLGLSISEGTILLFAVIASLIMAKIEGRRFSEYGLPLRGALGRNFWKGTVWGFLAIAGSLGAIFVLHGFRVTGFSTYGTTLIGATAAWTVTFLMVGLSEEFAFRGYLQFTLSTGVGFWPAAFVLSGLFGLAHAGNPGETVVGLFSVVLFGLVFCLFLRRTGDLWLAVGFHAGYDWGQTFFFGVPDSGNPAYHNLLSSSFSGPNWLTGGTVGPEASVITPIALLVVALLFSLRNRHARYDPPGQATPAAR
jgi:membrane protease YdiL (CAAX protease family)